MEKYKNDLSRSIAALQNGGIILYPTDTIWGIGCDATNAGAIQRIYQLKNRDEKKSLIILVSNEKMIENYVQSPSQKLLKIMSSSSIPTTGIFENAMHLPTCLVNSNGSIAIRIVNDPFCYELIETLGKPLVSTSANISSEKAPQNFTEVSEKIKSGVDYIVHHRQDDLSKHSPSKIIKLNDKNEIEFIR